MTTAEKIAILDKEYADAKIVVNKTIETFYGVDSAESLAMRRLFQTERALDGLLKALRERHITNPDIEWITVVADDIRYLE
jgi:hypothetical protein